MSAQSGAAALPCVGEFVFENISDLLLIYFVVKDLFYINRRQFVFIAIGVGNAVFGICAVFQDRFIRQVNRNGRHSVEMKKQQIGLRLQFCVAFGFFRVRVLRNGIVGNDRLNI